MGLTGPNTKKEDPVIADRRRAYALAAGQGWTYDYGADFTVKIGELGRGPRFALVEYTTRPGEEPADHTHPTEDEAYYVLEGVLVFRCGEDQFEVGAGGFVFLPRGIEHGYRITGETAVRLLLMTSAAEENGSVGWGGFVADIETHGDLRSVPPGSA